MKVIAFSDSSFANCRLLQFANLKSEKAIIFFNLGTRLGFAVLVADDTNRIYWLQYSSYNCRHTVRSVLRGKIYAFADFFDVCFVLKYCMESFINYKIPIKMYSDPESLFKVVVRSTTTTEKRFMIGVRATSEALERKEITNVG